MAIPWLKLVKYAPSVLSLTSDILQRSRSRKNGEEKSLEARIDVLEKNGREQAKALHAMAEQMEGMMAVIARLRRLLLGAFLMAGGALLLAAIGWVIIISG